MVLLNTKVMAIRYEFVCYRCGSIGIHCCSSSICRKSFTLLKLAFLTRTNKYERVIYIHELLGDLCDDLASVLRSNQGPAETESRSSTMSNTQTFRLSSKYGRRKAHSSSDFQVKMSTAVSSVKWNAITFLGIFCQALFHVGS